MNILEEFQSEEDASKYTTLLSGSGISRNINKQRASGGKHPITKEPPLLDEVNWLWRQIRSWKRGIKESVLYRFFFIVKEKFHIQWNYDFKYKELEY